MVGHRAKRYLTGIVLLGVGLAAVLAVAVHFRSARGRPEPTTHPGRPHHPAGVRITYPLDETIFPSEIPAPRLVWEDDSGAEAWFVRAEFADGADPISARCTARQWTCPDQQWETIKRRSVEQPARLTVTAIRGVDPEQRLSSDTVRISTSADPVGAPLFYREVILPFIDAVKQQERIRWRFGAISATTPPPVVLENLPACGNCHSFSADGSVLGMDVDYANDKGSYVIAPVAEEIVLDRNRIITWSDYRREDNEPTFGLFSQVSPDGRHVVSTVKDFSVFLHRPELMFSQLFFPTKGILVIYSRQTGTFSELSGANDRRFVQSNPAWSPDGRYIVFTRAEAREPTKVDGKPVLTEEEARLYLSGTRTFLFDLYRIPFNDAKGGQAEPLEGACRNGRSNYFPKYSPDGKWIVFCQARSFSLLQPDSELYIVPAEGGQARRLRCNTTRMNSWHTWSPNSRWLVFASKANGPYTQLFIAHIDQQGESSPPVLLANLTAPDRAANVPEFVNTRPDAIRRIVDRVPRQQAPASRPAADTGGTMPR